MRFATVRAMNILFVANAYTPALSGVALSAERFRTSLEQLGHRVTVIAPRYRGHVENDPRIIRVPTFPNPLYPEYPFALFRFSRKLRARLQQEHIQVVHVMQPFTVGRFARTVARALNVPLVFTHHARYDLYAHYVPLVPKKIAARRVTRSVVRFANTCDLLIAPSRSTKEFMTARGITKPIEVIPTGLAHTYRSTQPKAELRRQLSIPEDAFLLLCVSRISIEDKNLLLLLSAMPKIVAVLPKAHLILVGSGPDQAKLKEYAKTHGLEKFVRFEGPIQNDQLDRYYTAADLFVYPSISETQGIIILEALSAGLAVVATRAPGTIDFVSDGNNGLLTQNDPHSFAAAVIRVAQDQALRTELAKNALPSVSAYTSEAVAKKLVSAYQQIGRTGTA